MILIIAFGNELREDDGAGLVLAEAMENAWRAQGAPVRRIAVQQLTPELALEIAAPEVEAMVLVDTRLATANGSGDVAVAALSAAPTALPVVGHHLQPAVLLAYAAAVRQGPLPPSWLVTVPGIAFGHGYGLSPGTQGAISRALRDAASDLSRLMAGCWPSPTAA